MVLKYGFTARAVVLALIPTSALLRAHVLAQCWTWFVAPFGGAAIGKAHVYGLSLMVAFATLKVSETRAEDIATMAADREQEATSREASIWVGGKIVELYAYTLVFWLFAYIAHEFMGR